MTHECLSLIWNWTQLPFMHHRSLQKNIAVWSFSFWAKTLCRNTPSYQAALGNHWSGWSVLAFSRWTMEMKYINYIFYLYNIWYWKPSCFEFMEHMMYIVSHISFRECSECFFLWSFLQVAKAIFLRAVKELVWHGANNTWTQIGTSIAHWK